MAAQLLLPAIKALTSGGVKKAAMGAAKGVVKDKAKDFVTGKKRKGKGGALVKSGKGVEEQVEGGKGGEIVPTTPMVGSYKVETVSDKPEEVGKPSKVSYESINNQLDSIIGLTNVLKKTSAAKIKNAENRRKAERKAAEKEKKRQRESLLERGAGMALGVAGNLYGKATQGFDPLKFFAMIFLGNLFNWVTTHGSKIIGFLKAGLALFNNAGKLLKSGFSLLGKTFKAAFKLVGKLASPIIKLGKGIGDAIRGVGKKLGNVFGKVGKSLKNFANGILKKIKNAGKLLLKPFRAAPKVKPQPKGKTKPGKVFKGGIGRSTNRFIAKVGGKNALKMTKALKGAIGRIPVIGTLITGIVSILSGDPPDQTLFKMGGAAIGGVLGSFIPIPVVGTLVGEIIGEYVGDLIYVLTKDGEEGGLAAVNEKLRKDLVEPISKFFFGNKENKKPIRAHFPRGTKGTKEYQAAYKEWEKKNKSTDINPKVSASSPEGYVSSLMPQSKASKFYAAMGINEQMWKTYKDTIASIETSGYSLADSYKAIGGSGDAYDGRYQMGRLARMDAAQALGIPTPSREELRNNAQLQEDMFLAYTYKNYTYMSGASSQFDSANSVQKLQYLGYAHNQGHAFATDWLKTGVISSVDGFGTKGTKFTDKLSKTLKPYLDGTKPKVEKSDNEGKPVITPQTYTVSGITYDASTGLPISGHETPTPAQVSPSTQSQSQMSSEITGLSQQLSYEQTGNTVVMMQGSGGQQTPIISGGGKGTPVIMGSGDVVNSYYKSQLMGFLYKQG